MKRLFGLILVLVLVLSFCLVSFAEEPSDIPGSVEIPYAGFRFVPPEEFRDIVGTVAFEGAAELTDGIYYAVWAYYGMTEAELEAYMADHSPDAPAENRIIPVFMVFSIGNGRTFQDLNAMLRKPLPEENVTEIGKAGDWSFCLFMENPIPEFVDAVDPVYAGEYTAITGAAETFAKAFEVFEPTEKPVPNADLPGKKLEFETTDLDGNPVTSEELFSRNEVTVVNIWTSWCGPCIGELPELQRLHAGLREKGCGIVGLLDDDGVDTARRLIRENGVEYPVVMSPAGLHNFVYIEAVPTTLFVGRDGTVLAAPVVGAYPDEYSRVLDSLLGK